MARVGPIRRQALIIDEFVRDPRTTGVLAVALPEEIPVNETIDLEARLREELGVNLHATVLNSVLPQRFTAGDARGLEALAEKGSKEARAATRASLSEFRRARAERAQGRRLGRATRARVITLPHLFEPEIGAEELERLSRVLERRL